MNAPARMPNPYDTLTASTVAMIRDGIRQIEPLSRERAGWIALRAAIELCAPIHRDILRTMLAHDYASHMNPDQLDDLANDMAEHSRDWITECEGGAEYLRDPLNRHTGA